MPRNDPEISELKKALDELRIINNLILNISKIRETNHIMSVVISELIKVTDADQGVINLVAAMKDEDLVTVVRDIERGESSVPYKVNEQISGWVLKFKEMLKVDDLDSDDRFPKLDSQNGQFKSIIAFPMVIRDDIIGLTTLIRSDRKKPFTDDECRLTGIVASQAAQILANTRLMVELAEKNEMLDLSHKKLKEENLKLRSEITSGFSFENIIGKSQAMKQVLTLVSKFSNADSPVLITGETGTGKELIAKAIHHNSPRKNKPLVIKNCGVKTESLLESELFGHIKGSFTGAVGDKAGLFKEADGGTIFLDEIGDAPPSTQAAILRVIQDGEIRPIGASKTDHVDIRVISATNKDLKESIKDSSFREDLFYRLSTLLIEVPPLRNRKEDIPLLTDHFLGLLRIKTGKDNLRVTSEVIDVLINYDWPGNVRQLEHELERAAIVCGSDGEIGFEHISTELVVSTDIITESIERQGKLKDIVEKVERDIIVATLKEYNSNISQSSKVLGLTRKGLKDKITRYNLAIPRDDN
ncbi:MAG: GAF domain-containing protein [candidate division Zixibacteria bacterium]|nr:GAF domain-containing protein [candidate division Zixibacteria bacterium]